MTRTIYALFTAIDAYPQPVRQLKGCVNDVTRLRDLLAARMTGTEDRFVPLLLADADATRQGLIDAWRSHLGQAGPGDVALFYYSGHGSYENAPPEFWDFEPDKRNETLVCYDSRLPGGWDLADKELAHLIAEIAANGPHFTVILDCCHAGSGTRDAEDVTLRQEISDIRTRPIASYIVTPEQVAGMTNQGGGPSAPATPWSAIASGRHVLLAACRPEQKAKETYFPGPEGVEKRGAFSFYLQDTLQQTGAALSYRDIFKRINALVQHRVQEQHPQLEASDPADLEQPFLGGAIPTAPAAFTLSVDAHQDWVVDAGAVHGIPQPGNADETTVMAIFPFDTAMAQLRTLEQAIGEARIIHVSPGQSLVTPLRFDGTQLNPKTTYKAIITSTPLPPLAVAFDGDEAALDRVRQALGRINGENAPSLLVRESDLAGAEYRLLASSETDRYLIRRVTDARWLAVETSGLDVESAQIVALRLEHIARWVSTARLTNPSTQLAPNAVQLEIFREHQDGKLEPLDTSSGLRLTYAQEGNRWRWPRIQIRLRNTTQDQRLFCMLMDLTESYSIYTGLLPRGGVWLDPGEEAWATVLVRGRLRKTIDLYIPDGLFDQHRHAVAASEQPPQPMQLNDILKQPPQPMQLNDILKLIVSSDEADANLLQQGDLPVTFASSKRKTPSRFNTLNRLMARIDMRNLGAAPGSEEALVDWRTTEVALTVARPLEAVDVS
jgi:hypothetical protein